MKMSIDDIKREVAGGGITAISLDTSVFDGQRLGLEYGLLKRMGQFKGGDAKFVLSDVVVQEVLRHLMEAASKGQADTRKALKTVGHTWAVSSEVLNGSFDILFGDRTADAVAQERLDGFLKSTNAVIAKADGSVRVGDLVSRYFDRQPPFAQKEAAKHEFPDALALLTLEAWAENEDTKILVVSKDGDWTAFCEESEWLVATDDIGVALSAFQREVAQYTCQLLTQKLFGGDPMGLEEAVSRALEDQSWKIDFVVDADSEFFFEENSISPDITFEEIRVFADGAALEPVEYGDDFLVARVTAVVEAEITAEFSFKHWDGIDKEYMSMGSGTATTRKGFDVDVLVTFQGELPDNVDIDDVEVIEKRERAYFGDIEPDWMSNPDANE
jgi:hypothetical protein